MKLRRQDLEWAANEGLLQPAQVKPLWDGLKARRGRGGLELSFETAAYALGSILVLGALTWFTTRAWQIWGDGVLTLLLVGYAASFFAIGRELRFGRGLRLPGDLVFVFGIALIPLIVLGALRWSGLWDTTVVPPLTVVPRAQLQALAMSGATVAVGALALRLAPSPLLTAPIAIALGLFVLDGTLLALAPGEVEWDTRRLIGGIYGALLLLAALRIDHRRTEEDWAFWPYLVGLVFFWGAISAGNTDNEWVRFVYFALNVALLAASVLIRRPVFAAFGTLGAWIYLLTISNRLFRDSLLFPVVLVGVGIAVIFGGVQYRQHRENIEEWARRSAPAALRRLLPPER